MDEPDEPIAEEPDVPQGDLNQPEPVPVDEPLAQPEVLEADPPQPAEPEIPQTAVGAPMVYPQFLPGASNYPQPRYFYSDVRLSQHIYVPSSSSSSPAYDNSPKRRPLPARSEIDERESHFRCPVEVSALLAS